MMNIKIGTKLSIYLKSITMSVLFQGSIIADPLSIR